MNNDIEYSTNQADPEAVAAHLLLCNAAFAPPLSTRVDISAYAQKIHDRAVRFEAWQDSDLVGLVAAYCSDPNEPSAFVTSVSVLPSHQGQGVATVLMRRCLDHVQHAGLTRIELAVDQRSASAVALYQKLGFATTRAQGTSLTMSINLTPGRSSPMKTQRDYDGEIKNTTGHQYAYGFDFDVMHPYMIRSFEPFFRPGSLLELGSFKGDFTRRFLDYFSDITCVEASGVAIEEARRKLGERIKYIHSTFETAALPRRYDNIVLTHVLEHLDDPVRVLSRINKEWLADGGRLFLVCPNANAPSRQIAVKMGLISHNAAVTPAEAAHGHRCTYSLDTLERDAVAAGLNVMHRSGVFFKALANFQWDRLLQTDIITRDYLEGCYKLGQIYPDLCASIFLLCEPGRT